jgi:hypothetical protein
MDKNIKALLKCSPTHRSRDCVEEFQDNKLYQSRVLYKWVSRNFVIEGLFHFTMARIQLLLLALLASSISVRAKSINNQYGDTGGAPGEVQTNCESFLQ